jgi:hydrogenase maturation factor HypF (carbamoyltransferase family)
VLKSHRLHWRNREKSVGILAKADCTFALKNKLPAEINNGLDTIGAILPYMPIHYLLFEVLQTPAIVFTSGNISEEPVVIDDAKAKTIFTESQIPLSLQPRNL